MNGPNRVPYFKKAKRFETLVAVIAVALMAGCESSPPRPIVGELRTTTIKVAIPVTCVKESDLPKRPSTAMPPPDADVGRLMAGSVADARALSAYSNELEAAIKACVAAGGKAQ